MGRCICKQVHATIHIRPTNVLSTLSTGPVLGAKPQPHEGRGQNLQTETIKQRQDTPGALILGAFGITFEPRRHNAESGKLICQFTGLGQVTEPSLAAGRVSPPTDPPVPSLTALITCGSLGTPLSAQIRWGSCGKPGSGNGKGDFNRGAGLLCQYNCVLFGSFVFFQITLHREP